MQEDHEENLNQWGVILSDAQKLHGGWKGACGVSEYIEQLC